MIQWKAMALTRSAQRWSIHSFVIVHPRLLHPTPLDTTSLCNTKYMLS